MIDDPYSVLGLTPDASDEEVKPGHEPGRRARGGDDE